MCGSMVDIQCVTAEIRRGKKRRKTERKKKPQNKNIISASAVQGDHNNNICAPDSHATYSFWARYKLYIRLEVSHRPTTVILKYHHGNGKVQQWQKKYTVLAEDEIHSAVSNSDR